MTKKILSTIAACACLYASQPDAFAQGVRFQKISLARALDSARLTNKLVFADCYTDWCGSCKYMDDSVFSRAAEGSFFNEKFINVKFNMEGDDGAAIAERYRVHAYPTFLILRPDGVMQHKILGFSNDIIREATDGLDEQRAIAFLDKKYDEGRRDKPFLITYLSALMNISENEKANAVRDDLFLLLDTHERTSADCWFIYDHPEFTERGTENFDFLMAHLDDFRRSVGRELVDERVVYAYMSDLYALLARPSAPSPNEFKKMKKELSPCKLKNQAALFTCIDIFRDCLGQDAKQLLKTCKRGFRNLSEEQVDVGAYALNTLKTAFPGRVPELKALAKMLIVNVSNEEYKNFLTHMFDDAGTE
ncbi:MAG: thioredoxin family protein [Odoribacteraceae bacterium]|nr:thioredoxin family protein [Odoribacteraceae bacterium]